MTKSYLEYVLSVRILHNDLGAVLGLDWDMAGTHSFHIRMAYECRRQS